MKIHIENSKLEELINDGLSLKEISTIINVSLSTIKRRICELGLKSNFHLSKKESIICLNCELVFSCLISDKRKFCSSSCSSEFNNKNRKKKEKGQKVKRVRIFKDKNLGICLNCKLDIIRSDGRKKAKYCSLDCQHELRIKTSVESKTASTKTIKLYLIRKHGNKCMNCGWCEKNPVTNKVPIELEHIDGNSENNELSNLKILCPNCHSLTPTYKALNKGNGRHKRMERYTEGKSY